MQLDSLKKIIDTEDRTARHEMFRRWVQNNVTVIRASQPCIRADKMPTSQRDQIIEALAQDLASHMLDGGHVQVVSKDNTVVASVAMLKRII